jgi:pimeloyl-ACP methyl ester carboxylesterase
MCTVGFGDYTVKSVLDAEKVERCAVVGHSMGGYVALALAERHPQLIDKLVLFHSTANNDSDERKADRERVISIAQRNKSVYVKSVIPTLFAEKTREVLNKEIQELTEIALGFPTQGIIANIRGMMERKNQFDTLRNAAFETLIIHGEVDPVISTEDIKVQESLSAKVHLEIVPEIGHMGHLEAPSTCYEILSNFVGS